MIRGILFVEFFSGGHFFDEIDHVIFKIKHFILQKWLHSISIEDARVAIFAVTFYIGF